MSAYTCKIDEPYFSQILSGEKTIEGRIRRGKWAKMRLGDALFCKGEDGEEVKFTTYDLLYFDSFEELYQGWGSCLLPDLPVTAWEVYSTFPGVTREEEERYGVVGVKLIRA